jgi:uncharacterized protein (TIGR02611 family)
MTGMKHIKRGIVAVIGLTVLAIGVAMIVLPGPAIVVIPLGLGILATEFVWARSLLNRVKNKILKNKGGSINETE